MSAIVENISSYTDIVRLQIGKKLDVDKSELEQYFSSASLSRLMASMMSYSGKEISILDPGAGVGSLFVACVDEMIRLGLRPKKISITAYEIDKSLCNHIGDSLKRCRMLCERNGIEFASELIKRDFIADSAINLKNNNAGEFSHIILNPPYKKINTFSKTYHILNELNLQSPNLYTAFVALSEKMLQDGGELVFITPRSFCNGAYFQSFRKKFLASMNIKRIHLFDSRTKPFQDDDILQENIIVHAIKNKTVRNILISSNSSSSDENTVVKHLKKEHVLHPDDPQHFIHIVFDEMGIIISDKIRQLKSTLKDLGIDVSTGKVVDFRISDALRYEKNPNTVPLLRPFNLSNGHIKFPVKNKKENHIENTKQSHGLLVKNGNYVLVKRFSAKEERRRIIASVLGVTDFDYAVLGFENRINYFHSNGKSLDVKIAKGLSLFLNSTAVDLYFRQFNGNTQVNATDLRYIRYPTHNQLRNLASENTHKYLTQKQIDDLVEKVLFGVDKKLDDPLAGKQKIDEAIDILKQMGFPKQQQNDRSALTLLALLNLKPEDSWKKSKASLVGITPMMNSFEKNYGKKYAPNSRETVRRYTIHQFLQAGLVVENPDKPDRPTNSGKTVYEINEESLRLIQKYGSPKWQESLTRYKKATPSLKEQHSKQRQMQLIPLQIPDGKSLKLSAGGQNILVKKIYDDFCSRFTPGGIPLYIGDTRKKFIYYDKDWLKKLNIVIDPHGKIPDAVIFYPEKKWLVLIEAVTTHGPIDPTRRKELEKLFSKSKVGLVYVTAFLDFHTFKKYFECISWESEVWIAEHPSHMIHFNGSRFLGPYN